MIMHRSHVVIFPTWACQLSCAYCSVKHSKIKRNVRGVPWRQWARVLPTVLPPDSIVDVAGGEPCLYPGIVELLHEIGNKGLAWAMTTNAKDTDTIKRICSERPGRNVCINISDHAENPESRANKLRLRQAGYQVNVHRVDHPAAGHVHADAELIPYQDWSGGKATDGKVRLCSAGENHWIAAPNGDLYRCIVAAQTGQKPYSNLFTGKTTQPREACTFGCSSCYIEDPSVWGVEMEELACTV